jgi:antitoxin PrlF
MGRLRTVTSKGQVTIPKEVRDALGIKPHDRIDFVVEDGYATLRRLPTLEELAGSLPSLASLGLDISVEEAIRLAKEERAREIIDKMHRE